MNFEGISKKEAALILMLRTGLDINDTAKINSIYAKIKEKNMFSSDFGKMFEEELTGLKDGSALNNECISCGIPLDAGEFAICDNCLKKLTAYAKDESGDETTKSADTLEEPDSKPEDAKVTINVANDDVDEFKQKYGLNEKPRHKKAKLSKSERQKIITKLLLIVSAVLLVCVVVLSVAFFRMSLKNAAALDNLSKNIFDSQVNGGELKQSSAQPVDMIDSFSTYAEIQGYSLSEGSSGDEGSIIYEINPTNDYLIAFYDDDKNMTGIALQMIYGDDEDSQVEQLSLMAFLLASVYDDFDLAGAGEFLEQDILNGDIVVRGNYSWNMAKLEDKVVLMGIDVRYNE